MSTARLQHYIARGRQAGIGVLVARNGSIVYNKAFGTTYWVDLKEGIVALLYTRKAPNNYGDLNDKFKGLVYQAIVESIAAKR
ncbi:hypothetical protein GCM10027341_39640 [Spirosoma knui]